MDAWLPVVWYGVIGFGVLMYVLLDGFVLGLGILAPFAEDEHQLDHMMNTAAPIWDGNETWLVLGGAGLLAAFPKAYAVVLSALYLPVLLMLIALVFRGVAFEFRFRAQRAKAAWGVAFSLGSLLAAFAQPLRTEFTGTQLRLATADGARWTFDSQDVPTSAGREDEHAGAQGLWRGGVQRWVACEKQVGPDGSALPSASVFLAWATSMSRGSGTPFFTASTSAMMLTAISGGVLLPM